MTDARIAGDTVIVLAVHGAPPRDFPGCDLAEYFTLHARRDMAGETLEPTARECFLEDRLRTWRRTPSNDPFWAASLEMGMRLEHLSGHRVLVGFNEFCSPSVDAALDEAAGLRPARIMVMTPMLTLGGAHAETDIPASIGRARMRHPEVAIDYAWPYDPEAVAGFLAEHAKRALGSQALAP